MSENHTDLWSKSEVIGSPNFSDDGVTTVILAYNSAPFLEAAIQSALMQELDKPHQIWIHDDASNDHTVELIRRYVREHKGKIFAILQSQNLVSRGVRLRNIIYEKIEKGYIASLDGDDYWTDPLKLHKQCLMLDENSRASMVVHSWRRVTADGDFIDVIKVPGKYRRNVQFQSFLFDNPLCSATVVLRASSFHQLRWSNETIPTSQDWELWAQLASVGEVISIKDVMADFRFYTSVRSLTFSKFALHDQALLREIVASQTKGLNIPRSWFARRAGALYDRLSPRYPTLAKNLGVITKIMIESSSGNIVCRTRY